MRRLRSQLRRQGRGPPASRFLGFGLAALQRLDVRVVARPAPRSFGPCLKALEVSVSGTDGSNDCWWLSSPLYGARVSCYIDLAGARAVQAFRNSGVRSNWSLDLLRQADASRVPKRSGEYFIFSVMSVLSKQNQPASTDG